MSEQEEAAAKLASDTRAADAHAQDDGEIEETLDATVGAGEAAPGLKDPELKGGYDPGRYQDATRSYIAYWLLALLTMIVVGGFAMLLVVPGITFENLKSVLELVLGPIVALVSAATGFYFGAQQAAANRRS